MCECVCVCQQQMATRIQRLVDQRSRQLQQILVSNCDIGSTWQVALIKLKKRPNHSEFVQKQITTALFWVFVCVLDVLSCVRTYGGSEVLLGHSVWLCAFDVCPTTQRDVLLWAVGADGMWQTTFLCSTLPFYFPPYSNWSSREFLLLFCWSCNTMALTKKARFAYRSFKLNTNLNPEMYYRRKQKYLHAILLFFFCAGSTNKDMFPSLLSRFHLAVGCMSSSHAWGQMILRSDKGSRPLPEDCWIRDSVSGTRPVIGQGSGGLRVSQVLSCSDRFIHVESHQNITIVSPSLHICFKVIKLTPQWTLICHTPPQMNVMLAWWILKCSSKCI